VGRNIQKRRKPKLVLSTHVQKNPMYGRAGEDSPRFGILHTVEARVKMGPVSQYIYVFDASTKQLISSNLGLREACREKLSMSHHTIRKHIASGKAYKGMILVIHLQLNFSFL